MPNERLPPPRAHHRQGGCFLFFVCLVFQPWFCYKTLTEANCCEDGGLLRIQQVTIKALTLITGSVTMQLLKKEVRHSFFYRFKVEFISKKHSTWFILGFWFCLFLFFTMVANIEWLSPFTFYSNQAFLPRTTWITTRGLTSLCTH